MSFCCLSSAWADTVELHSGEKLIGTLVRVEGGKMIFKSATVGEVTIPMDQVAQITTEDPVTMHLQDGRVNRYRIHGFDDGVFTVDDEGRSRQVASSDLASVNPSAPPPNVDWTGSINVGLTATSGNTNETSGSFSFDITRNSRKTDTQKKTRWNSKALYVFSIDEVDRGIDTNGDGTDDDTEKVDATTEENVTLSTKYDYFFSDTYYGFANASWKKDHIADLERRTIFGAGLGKEWIDDGKFLLTTDAGVSRLQDVYETPASRTNDINVSAYLGYVFNWNISKKFDFLHNTVYYPSLEEMSDYFLTGAAELRAKLAADWFASLKALLDYDSTPGEGSKSTDMKYILSLSYTF